MIRVFYGEDRARARKMAGQQLGKDFETIEGESLALNDLPSVFLGTSLFGDQRAILLKDLSLNKECWEALPRFASDCSHNVVILESKIDKRSVAYKALSKDKNVEFKEFAAAKDPDQFLAFDVITAALAGKGAEALRLCARLELESDAYMFMGLFLSQVLKKIPSTSARFARVMKILAQADMDMKTTGLEPWSIMKVAIIKIAKER